MVSTCFEKESLMANLTHEIERERRFLIASNDVPFEWVSRKLCITNWYRENGERVRRSVDMSSDSSVWEVTVKKKIDGATFSEQTREMGLFEKIAFLLEKYFLPSITKNRHFIYDFFNAQVDVFPDFDDLVIVEIEFTSAEKMQNFKPVGWLSSGIEITGLKGWSNRSLAEYGLPDDFRQVYSRL